MFADLNGILERFVVGVDEELGGPEVTVETFNGPDDATGFDIESDPGSFVVEGGTGDEEDGTDEAVGLFLLEGRAKAVYVASQ